MACAFQVPGKQLRGETNPLERFGRVRVLKRMKGEKAARLGPDALVCAYLKGT